MKYNKYKGPFEYHAIIQGEGGGSRHRPELIMFKVRIFKGVCQMITLDHKGGGQGSEVAQNGSCNT